VSCAATGRASSLGVETDIACPAQCTLRPAQTAPHKILLANYGPLEATVKTNGSCVGPLLGYTNGTTGWAIERKVPTKRSSGKQTRQETIELAAPEQLGEHGAYEQVVVEARRAVGTTGWERPVTLMLELELKR